MSSEKTPNAGVICQPFPAEYKLALIEPIYNPSFTYKYETERGLVSYSSENSYL